MDISYENIGNMLVQIHTGNPAAAPPIHIITNNVESYCHMAIVELFYDKKIYPTAVLMIAGGQRSSGMFYWCKDKNTTGAPEIVKKWMGALGLDSIDRISAMCIGNSM